MALKVQDRRIVVTRAPHQAGELAALLREAGAEALLYPCIAILPPTDTTALDESLRKLAAGEYDWLLLSSQNTVEALRQRAEALGLSLAGVSVACVGPATADVARAALKVDVRVVPEVYSGEALTHSLPSVADQRILLPQADIAPPVLHDQLTAAGAEVHALTAYRTVMGQGGVDLPLLLRQGQVDAITYTSASTVQHCMNRLQAEGGNPALLGAVKIACIGPKTAQAATDAGLRDVLVPADYTLAGLVALLARAFS